VCGVMAGPSRQSIVLQQLEAHENAEFKRGGSIMKDEEPFDDEKTRPCRDVMWALMFYLTTGFLCWWCATGALMVTSGAEADEATGAVVEIRKKLHESEEDFFAGAYALLAAGFAAVAFSLVFLEFAKRFSVLTIWVALILGPVLLIIIGILMMLKGMPLIILGGIKVSMGVCGLACVICCWADLIPFSAALLRTVIHVMELHTSMIFVSIWGGFLSCLWTVLCCLSVLAYAIRDAEAYQHLVKARASSSPAKAGAVFLFGFLQYWGTLTAMDAVYTACSGVFGRWYFSKDRRPGDTPVMSSLKAAYTTSFGSVCCGAFIVAFIRALELLVRVLRQEAQEEGNYVLCILLMIVECVIDCIGDIMEWVCSWCYVQCAVRGLSFFQACSATFALASFAGLDSICARSVIGMVPVLGALPAGACSGAAGYYVFKANGTEVGARAESVAFLCFWVGLSTAWAALMPLKSGASTIIVCFAEEPDFLRRQAPRLHEMFTDQARESVDSSVSSRSSLGARDLRAAPMLEMQPAGTRQLQVTVPAGVVSGQMVQVQTPEGQNLQVQVPAGFGPGQQFVASY